jgi:ribonuclease Z
MIPAFDACFDLGHCPAEAIGIRNLFLSHVHQDHASGAIRHISLREMTNHSPPKIYLPEESAEAFIDVLRATERLERHEPRDLSKVVIPVAAGQLLQLSKRYRVQAFDVNHRVPSRGYTVIESRKKLKPQYQNLTGPEIGELVRSGQEVHEYHDVQLFTYVGDSTLSTLKKNPDIGKSLILFLEATHIGDTSTKLSEQYGHTHLDEIAALWKDFPEPFMAKHIVLKHFSMRYGADEIREQVAKLPKEWQEKITILI